MRPFPAVLMLLAVATSAFAGTACRESAILCQGGDIYTGDTLSTTTDAVFEKMCSNPTLNVEDANANIPAGRFEVYVAEGGEITLWLRDDFTVTGPAPGTPISLHMRIRLEGYLNYTGSCCPDSQAHVDVLALDPQAGDPEVHWSFGKSGAFASYTYSDSVDFTLARTAWSPIGIEIHALSRLHHSDSARITGQFTFLDLQPGWTVSSCKGYHLDRPVPASFTSWGRLKSTYR